MEQMLRRTWAEIDLDDLTHNFKTLQQRVGEKTKIVGVVKADAYGHGALQISRALEELGAGYLAVSNLDEARELRTAGISMPILILGHTPEQYVPQLLEYNITQAVTCEAKALAYNNMAKACGGKLRVHIKADTGMSRLGFLCADGHFEAGVEGILRSCELPYLDAEGIFTHFAVSDEPEKPERSLHPKAVPTLHGSDWSTGGPGPHLSSPPLRQQRRSGEQSGGDGAGYGPAGHFALRLWGWSGGVGPPSGHVPEDHGEYD